MFPLFYGLIKKKGRVSDLPSRFQTDLIILASEVLFKLVVPLAHYRTIPRHEILDCMVTLLESIPRVRSPAKLALVGFCKKIGETQLSETPSPIFEAEDTIMTQVLLNGLLSPEMCVREACASGLEYLALPRPLETLFDTRIWIAKHDVEEDVRVVASRLWDESHESRCIGPENLPGIINMTS